MVTPVTCGHWKVFISGSFLHVAVAPGVQGRWEASRFAFVRLRGLPVFTASPGYLCFVFILQAYDRPPEDGQWLRPSKPHNVRWDYGGGVYEKSPGKASWGWLCRHNWQRHGNRTHVYILLSV